MGMFDSDPKYRQLRKLRDSGYTGPVDQDGNPSSAHADIFRALDENTQRAMERGQK